MLSPASACNLFSLKLQLLQSCSRRFCLFAPSPHMKGAGLGTAVGMDPPKKPTRTRRGVGTLHSPFFWVSTVMHTCMCCVQLA